jgi:predicted GNAT family acetyltransferase
MKYIRFDNPTTFYDHVKSFLVAQEAEHNLILGITRGIQLGEYGDIQPYFGCVEDNGQVVAVILRTQPHNVLLSQIENPDAILPAIIEDLRDVFPSLQGVIASKLVSRLFAEMWEAATGQPFYLATKERIYKLESVIFPQGVAGEFRWATQDDAPFLVEWHKGFIADAGLPPTGPDQSQKTIRRFLDSPIPERRLGIWMVDGQPVSMSGYMGSTPNGMRVGAVYTPRDQRKKGYAGACVATLSQHILDMGKKFCFLFTDLANPTSNHIYQEIGYKPVADVDEYRFEESPL